MTPQPPHEKPAEDAPVIHVGMEKRGVIDDETPFFADQDELDMVEKKAGAELVEPRRPA